jgi:uncharacterized membrane protein YfcA
MTWIGIAFVGLAVGFLSGLFGKGGSAIATPLLHALGIPAIVAVAAPLPATIPSTLAATAAYWHARLLDRQVLTWSFAFGIPATIAGAVGTRWVSGEILVVATDVIVALLGLRFLLFGSQVREVVREPAGYRTRLAIVATVAGLAAGLLANSGGFLLAPLYLAVLRMPIKKAFASSLAVSAVLAVPGTAVHAALGHIDWAVVAVFGTTAIPFSYAGARVAQRIQGQHLERIYGGGLTVLGIAFLLVR